MAGDEEVEDVEAIEADVEGVTDDEAEEVEGFGINIGSVGTVFKPVVKPGGGGGPKTPEGTPPGGSTVPTKPSAPFDPNTVHF